MSNPVVDNPSKGRFEMGTPAGLAVAHYRLDGNVMTIYHTEVPVALRGRGVGGQLVEGVLSELRRLNLKVVPSCGFVRAFMQRNTQFQDLLA